MDGASEDSRGGGDDQGSSTAHSAPQPQGGDSTPSAPSSSGPPSAAPSGAAVANPSSKRRRGLGIVTANACTECRKKRAKCDGQRPCGRCKAQKDVECVYEIPVRQSKENLRTEIETLRYQKRSSDQVFAALMRPDAWEGVMQRLRNGQTIESISDWLADGGSSAGGSMASFGHGGAGGGGVASGPPVPPGYANSGPIPALASLGLGGGPHSISPITSQPQGAMRGDVDQHSPWHFSSQDHIARTDSHADSMSWSTTDLNRPPQGRIGSWADPMTNDAAGDASVRYRGLDQVLAPLDYPEMKQPVVTWTNITTDIVLVQHLLALYFCWEYPTFASLSKEHFLKDFQYARPRYCSSILINALLALGCRFSTKASTRAYPNDPYSSGDHFFKECQRLLYMEEDHHNLTTIQALGIMSIREASCGRDSESWFYAGQSIRLAVEMGLHQVSDRGDEDEVAVQAATFWGAFALDHAWSLATGSLPQCSSFPHLPPKPAIIDDIEASLWIPYTDDGAPLQRSAEQPSNVRSVYKCFCELSELVHQSLYVLHSPGRPLTSRDLLKIYTKYLNWYDSIPEVLRLGHNFTPSVLFTHMYYHFAILLLFRPLIKLRIIGSKVLPRDVCSQAADAIQGLLRSHSQLYTLRRTPSFVPYFVLTSSIMHLAIGASNAKPSERPPEDVMEPSDEAKEGITDHVARSIKQGVEDLKEMTPCHHFAEQALNILRYLAQKWNIDVDMGNEDYNSDDHARNVRPYTSSLNFFAPNIREEDFVCAWGTGASSNVAVGGGTSGNMATGTEIQVAESGETMENPLFWPFPMQGRPMLPSGHELREAGFERLPPGGGGS